MAGAPIGNTNARKENRMWADAIRKTIIQGKRLDALAEKLVSMAAEGDMQALKEIGDRLDGKPSQSIDANIDLTGNLATLIEAARKRIEHAGE
jgi:hypothetical protein